VSEKVKQRLLEKGSLKRIPEPMTQKEIKKVKARKLIVLKGKPLSETIIEERR
jgi:hypothetical protein